MGRTPVVNELGPGGGVGTMVRSESDCEVPGLPGGVRGSMEGRAGARSAIDVDTARWISAWRFADMTAAFGTLGGGGGGVGRLGGRSIRSVVGAEAVDQLVFRAFGGKAGALTSVAEVAHRHAAKGRSSRLFGGS